MTDLDIMPFGKHKGKQMQDVPADYLIWLLDNGLKDGGVKDYITENKKVLEVEVKRKRNG